MFNFGNQNNYCMNGNAVTCNSSQNDVKNFDTLQNARKDLVGEIDAIIQYDSHIHTTDDKIAKSTWENIRNEELVHVGELLGLITYLAPYQKELIEKGLAEFNERVKMQ